MHIERTKTRATLQDLAPLCVSMVDTDESSARKGRSKQRVARGARSQGLNSTLTVPPGIMNVLTRNTLFGLCLCCPDFRADYLLTAQERAASFTCVVWR